MLEIGGGIRASGAGARFGQPRESVAPSDGSIVELIRTAEVTIEMDSELAVELAERWLGPIRAADWAGRLSLLNDVHDHLREEIPDFDRFCDVFPQFIAELIRRIADPTVRSSDQAHIFANSADERHRQAAAAWFAEQSRRDRR